MLLSTYIIFIKPAIKIKLQARFSNDNFENNFTSVAVEARSSRPGMFYKQDVL